MSTMNRQPNNLTTRIMRASAPFALAGVVVLAGVGCGKSPQARAGGAKTEAPSSTPSLSAAVWADSDDDGVPDAAELSSSDDRDSYRRWFAYIAEMQFYKLSGRLERRSARLRGACPLRVARGAARPRPDLVSTNKRRRRRL